MPITSRRMRPALAAVVSLLIASAAGVLATPSALAGASATVTVRVLAPTGSGSYQTLIPITQVTTTAAAVVREGQSCPGTSALGALSAATKENWIGKFEFGDWFLTSIAGGLYDGPEYWSFWLNNTYSPTGVCGTELAAGDQLLFFPECYSETEPSKCEPGVLAIEAPPIAEARQPTTITVNRYNGEGKRLPAAGVNVRGWGESATTNAEGKATITFAGDSTYTLRATGVSGEEPLAVPGEALVCVHEGDDGECGTTRSSGGTFPTTGSSITTGEVGTAAPYTGAYAVVADVTGIHEGHVYSRGGGPRVLAGTVTAHAPVTSIALRLRRSYKGRCWAYNGRRERLLRARCGRGGFFQIATGGDSFSYLLPSRLPAGRYVLDIAATDSAGSKAPLDRGSSRIVFYVK